MIKDIYDPLSEYINVFRDRFQQVAKSTFEQLAAEAEVDVGANRQTCAKLKAAVSKRESLSKTIGWWKFLCVLLWIIAGAALAFAVFDFEAVQSLWAYLLPAAIAGIGAIIALELALIHPKLKALKRKRDEIEDQIRKLQAEAWKQMEPLNSLYDWDILTRMMSQTVPRLEFDPFFTTQRLADLQQVYDLDLSYKQDCSVICSHSGLINGNPFVIFRSRSMQMGRKVYTGHITISWTTTERGADGKTHIVTHTQVLSASVSAPYPEYYEKAFLLYGNTAAPDLIFHRRQSDLAGKENTLKYKSTRRKLRKKARDLSSKDFAMMTNEDFEVAFNTSDRNNNQQFALLFTPLAQESMLKLLSDESAGYGDDFDFIKHRMINTIVPDHLQTMRLDMNPDQYKGYDYDKAEQDFYCLNAELFRAIYFALAPLLCVPAYQQIRPQEAIYGRDMKRESAFWEHESLANFWGEERFKHPDCVTHCILKTEQSRLPDGGSSIKVSAHGYRSERRVEYKQVWGGDGCLHTVPVPWDEYLPVTGHGAMSIKEDDNPPEASSRAKDRISHIRQFLSADGYRLYRRHIASKLE